MATDEDMAKVEAQVSKTQDKPEGIGGKVKSAAEIFKSIGVFLAFGWVLISFVAILFWEARGEPWLTDRLKLQLEKSSHEDWIRRQVLLSLTDNRDALADKIDSDYRGRPLIESFQRTVSSHDMSVLFENPLFQERFLREVLLSVSNRDEEKVNEILAAYDGEDLLDIWLNPPSVSALAGTVTEQVDALYTYELFFTREARWESGRPMRDSEGNQIFQTRSQVSERFYANSNQRITIEVDPNLTGRFREAFDSGKSQLFLEIGSTYRAPIPRNGLIEEITCIVKEQLRGKPSGFVSLRAITNSGDIPDGGYELDVIITARKGGYPCT